MSHHIKKKRTEDDSILQESGQKPMQLQRRRVWRACESCRRKKIKCDGTEPTCSQCVTSGSQCTWLQTKDRAALSRHYVQELEARLLHMESLFAQVTPVLEQMGHSVSGLSIAGASTAPATTAAVDIKPIISQSKFTQSQDRRGADSPANSSGSGSLKVDEDVSESFGQLALDDHGHMRWIGGSSTMSLIQSFRALTTSPIHRVSPMEEDPRAPGPSVNKLYFPASVFFGKVHALPGPEEVEYPQRDLADKLVDAYFTRFHFLMPVIDKPSFLSKYRNVMDNVGDTAIARKEAAFISVVFAVFACAASLVDDPRLSTGDSYDDGGMGMVYYERALILHYISHVSTQISHVQCFILMSSFLCSVNCLPQAWLLVGQAVRIGQDLGLHRSPRRLLINNVEKETRRKVWWGLYSLDRMLALALGRPLGVEDSDCDVEPPIPFDDDDLSAYFDGAPLPQTYPSLMVGFISLTGLYKIAGRVLREVYAIDVCKDHLEPDKRAELQRSVENLDQELTQWCDELPPVFKSQPATERQVSMGAVLCSHYYSVLTTLHRNFLPVKHEAPMAPKSVGKAVASARACIRLAPSIRNVVPPSHHLAFFIQHLFSSAVILLLYAMHVTTAGAPTAAMDEAKSTLVALESWEGHWPGARKCRELLVELTNTAQEAVQKDANGVQRSNAPISMLPLVSPPRPSERRRSVTLASSTLPPANARAVKSVKHRRNMSRDAAMSRRHLTSPYRVDSQRARSSSRKRGHDEGDALESSQKYYKSFSNPNSPNSKQSPHSSPHSANLPSPQLAVADQPTLVPAEGHIPSTSYGYQNIPLSPVQVPSDPRYDYEFPIHHSPLAASASLWAGTNNGDSNGNLEMFPSSTPTDTLTYPATFHPEAGYYTFDQDVNAGYSLSTTPPSTSFAATGLPFRGLDYIRNYNPGGYPTDGEQDLLWQTFDPGAFGYDPELPFTIGDIPIENQAVGGSTLR